MSGSIRFQLPSTSSGGDVSVRSSGTTSLHSGSSGSGAGGALQLKAGDSKSGTGGKVEVSGSVVSIGTADSESAANTGAVSLSTGTAAAGSSGLLSLSTGASATSHAGAVRIGVGGGASGTGGDVSCCRNINRQGGTTPGWRWWWHWRRCLFKGGVGTTGWWSTQDDQWRKFTIGKVAQFPLHRQMALAIASYFNRLCHWRRLWCA